HAPIVLWEEDMSGLKQHLEDLRRTGVTDFEAFFERAPEEALRCLSKAKILDVNQAAVDLWGARNKVELLAGLDRVMTPEALSSLKQLLIALTRGQTIFETETVIQTFAGRKMNVYIKFLIAPDCAATWSRIYVSIVDLTARKALEEQHRQT